MSTKTYMELLEDLASLITEDAKNELKKEEEKEKTLKRQGAKYWK